MSTRNAEITQMGSKNVGGFAGSLDSLPAKDAVIEFALAAEGLLAVMNAAKTQIDTLKAQNADLQITLNGADQRAAKAEADVARIRAERNTLREQMERIEEAVNGF